MKILVAVKRVIDYNVQIRVKEDNSGVVTDNVKMSTNPPDDNAIEEAVKIKEAGKATEVVAVSIGEEKAQETVRKALAVGADRGILVKADGILEPLAVSKLLHKIVEKEKPDLVFMGKQAIDDDCNQTGQMLAALLNWPQATFASKIDVKDKLLEVTREVDEGLDPSLMSNMLRIALNSIVGDIDSSNVPSEQAATQNLPTAKKSAKLGSKSTTAKIGGSSMEEILQNQADSIANDIEDMMDGILDEEPDFVAILPRQDQIVIDPAVLKFTKLVAETAHELMWDIGKPGNVSDITLRTRIEDVTEMLGDVITSLPKGDEEE